MVVRLLDVNKDPFRPQGNDEEILDSEVPYLSTIGALMYLANTTRPDIAFAVNLLARQGIVLLLLGDIGMGSNTFCDILKGQLI